MKISENLYNKTEQQLDFLFDLSWSISFYNEDGKMLWSNRVKITKSTGCYVTKPTSSVAILDGAPKHWILSRGRYKIEGSAGTGGEITTPDSFLRGQIFRLNPTTIVIKGRRE